MHIGLAFGTFWSGFFAFDFMHWRATGRSYFGENYNAVSGGTPADPLETTTVINNHNTTVQKNYGSIVRNECPLLIKDSAQDDGGESGVSSK